MRLAFDRPLISVYPANAGLRIKLCRVEYNFRTDWDRIQLKKRECIVLPTIQYSFHRPIPEQPPSYSTVKGTRRLAYHYQGGERDKVFVWMHSARFLQICWCGLCNFGAGMLYTASAHPRDIFNPCNPSGQKKRFETEDM